MTSEVPWEGIYLANINFDVIPVSVQIDLCSVAIRQTAIAMATPEGRAAIEKGKAEYIRHLKERGVSPKGASAK